MRDAIIIVTLAISNCIGSDLNTNNSMITADESTHKLYETSTLPFCNFISTYDKSKDFQHSQCLHSPEMNEQTKIAIAQTFKSMRADELTVLKELADLGLIPESMHPINKLIFAKAYTCLPNNSIRIKLNLPLRETVLSRLLNLKSIYEKGVSLKTGEEAENDWTHEVYEEQLFKRLNTTGYNKDLSVTYAQPFLDILVNITAEWQKKELILMLHKAREFNLNITHQASLLVSPNMPVKERLYIIQAVAGFTIQQSCFLTGTKFAHLLPSGMNAYNRIHAIIAAAITNNMNNIVQELKQITTSEEREVAIYQRLSISKIRHNSIPILPTTTELGHIHTASCPLEATSLMINPTHSRYYYSYAIDSGHCKRPLKDKQIGFLYGYVEGLNNFPLNPFFLTNYGSDYYAGYDYGKNNLNQSHEEPTIQSLQEVAQINFGMKESALLDKARKLTIQMAAMLKATSHFASQGKNGLALFSAETSNTLIRLENEASRTLHCLNKVPEFQQLFSN